MSIAIFPLFAANRLAQAGLGALGGPADTQWVARVF
jgi:hypothetical protein